MDTDVRLVVPWRPTPDRLRGFQLAMTRWHALGLHPILADSGARRFNLAASRNAGFVRAEVDGAAVVIVADADTFGDETAIVESVDAARTSGLVHTPYRAYRSLGAIGTAQLAAGADPADCSHVVVPGACSGIFVASPKAWWSVGGMDERFTVWAPEDYAFRLAHEALLGPMPRHDGNAYALTHHDQAGKASGPEYERCVELYHRYRDAAGDTAAVSALVAEWQ